MNSVEREYLELQGSIAEVLEEISAIKRQFTIYGARVAVNRKNIDRKWVCSAKTALAKKSLEHQRLMAESAALKIKIKNERIANSKEESHTFEHAFFCEVRKFLPYETFVELCNKARSTFEVEA